MVAARIVSPCRSAQMDRTEEVGGYGGERDTPVIFVAGACFALALARVMLDQFLRVRQSPAHAGQCQG